MRAQSNPHNLCNSQKIATKLLSSLRARTSNEKSYLVNDYFVMLPNICTEALWLILFQQIHNLYSTFVTFFCQLFPGISLSWNKNTKISRRFISFFFGGKYLVQRSEEETMTKQVLRRTKLKAPIMGYSVLTIPHICHFFSTGTTFGSIFLHAKTHKLYQNRFRDKIAQIARNWFCYKIV